MKVLADSISVGAKKEGFEGITDITRIIRPLIDKIAHDIFFSYKLELLIGTMDYIVPAVWGEKKDGQHDSTQQEIYRKVFPVIRTVLNSLELKDLSPSQEFAIDFLIRELLISKITFAIEMMKNMMINAMNSDEQHVDLLLQNSILSHLEPIGNA